MMNICEENKCTGCGACLNVCPKQCISMTYNSRLELVPQIGTDCVNCGLCKKKCPVNNSSENKNKSLKCYAAYSSSYRESSSSGGIASSLANAILTDGGVVCGCIFDGKVHHIVSSDKDTVYAMRGSKYVQSQTDRCYAEIKKIIATRKCLFIGTPCQVAAVKSIVGNSENIYCIDLICHGTPSPRYLQEVIESFGGCENISFRNNDNFTMTVDGKSSNISERYMMSFLNGLTFRESCYSCPFAEKDRVGDITLGDFWEIKNFKNKQSGVSLVLINSSKGEELLQMATDDIVFEERTFEEAYFGNPQLVHPSIPHKNRKKYIELLSDTKKFDTTVKQLLYKERLKNWLKKRELVKLILRLKNRGK